jgi:hypothetical protein
LLGVEHREQLVCAADGNTHSHFTAPEAGQRRNACARLRRSVDRSF